MPGVGVGFHVGFLTHDVLRRERWARSLRDELTAVDGVEVRFATTQASPAPGAKGGALLADAALWVFLGTATRAGARVAIEAIRAWSAKERHRSVRITVGEQTIEIPGSPDEAQERLVAKLLDKDDG